MPNPVTVMASSSDWGNSFFNEFWPWVLIGVGAIFAFIIIRWLIRQFSYVIHGEGSFFTKPEVPEGFHGHWKRRPGKWVWMDDRDLK